MTTDNTLEPTTKSEIPAFINDLGVENPLSEREMEVARLLATGASNAEIARTLIISPHTVKVHLRNIFEKLQVVSRTEASMLLVQRGWLTVHGVEIPVSEIPAALVENATPLPRPALPEPEPLTNLPAQVMPWQRLYLAIALVACLLAVIVPNLRGRVQALPALLTDAGRTVVQKTPLLVQERWDVRPALAQPRTRLTLVRLGNQLYAVGGELPNGKATAEVAAYELSTSTWRTLAPLPEPLANHAAAALNGYLYVAGGSASPQETRNTVYRFDLAKNQWSSAAPLPTPLAGAVLVADEGALYLLGGWDGQQMHDEVWRLKAIENGNKTSEQWELLTRLDKPRAFLGATLVEEKLYAIGGYDGQKELDLAAVYNIKTNTWQQLPPLSVPRGGLSVLYDGLGIFALGGGWSRPLATHERYDPLTNVWASFPSPIPGEWRHAAAAMSNGRIHLVGGWGGDYLDIHLQYQSSYQTSLPLISND